MNMPPRDADLIDAGWTADAPLGEIAAHAADLWERGIHDEAYLIKLLQRRFPQADRRLRRRAQPLDHTEAIEAELPVEQRNLATVRRQMRELMRVPVVTAGALMPDACPVGGGEGVMPVGGAVAAHRAILPAAHSMDICCSVRATVFAPTLSVAESLDRLAGVTRFGPGGRSPDERVAHPVLDEAVWSNPFLQGLEERAAMHLADQGDGNHFAFLGRLADVPEVARALAEAGHDDPARALTEHQSSARELHVLVTHHGSRGLGAKVFERGLKAAVKATSKIAEGIPESAAWLSMDEQQGRDYCEALQYVSRWTRANHDCVHQRFLEATGACEITGFGNEHNFVWQRGDHWLHGKGATPAWTDDLGRPLLGLIPLNMAQPILITLGRDRADALGFAPHGAGRNLSRTALMRAFRKQHGSLSGELVEREIRRATAGIDVRWFSGKPDYSESPAGYKQADEIRRQIDRFELAHVIGRIEPLGCLMAGHMGDAIRQRREELTLKQKRQIVHRADRRTSRQRMRDQLGGGFSAEAAEW